MLYPRSSQEICLLGRAARQLRPELLNLSLLPQHSVLELCYVRARLVVCSALHVRVTRPARIWWLLDELRTFT